VKVEDTPTFSVSEKLTVIVEDAWATAVANVPVKMASATGPVVATGSTDAEGKFVATVAAYVQTAAGKDSRMQPHAVTTNCTLVPTTGYPGYNAEWSPKIVTKSANISGPSSVTIQTGMIIRYQLVTVARGPGGRAVPGASVVYKNAQGETVKTGTTNAQGQYSDPVIAYVMNPSGKDTTMNPYSVVAAFSSGEVQSLVDTSSGSMSIAIMEHVEPAYDWTPVAVMDGVAALVLGAALFVAARKP